MVLAKTLVWLLLLGWRTLGQRLERCGEEGGGREEEEEREGRQSRCGEEGGGREGEEEGEGRQRKERVTTQLTDDTSNASPESLPESAASIAPDANASNETDNNLKSRGVAETTPLLVGGATSQHTQTKKCSVVSTMSSRDTCETTRNCSSGDVGGVKAAAGVKSLQATKNGMRKVTTEKKTAHSNMHLTNHSHTSTSPNRTEGGAPSGGGGVAGLVRSHAPKTPSVAQQPWSQFQQRQLEWALAKFPKFSEERWLNIARAVPGKTQVSVYTCSPLQLYCWWNQYIIMIVKLKRVIRKMATPSSECGFLKGNSS